VFTICEILTKQPYSPQSNWWIRWV